MAKFDSILGLRGTFQQITFVKSKAYGYHVRAARGTHKKAEVNQALKDSAERLASGNIPAKILRDAFAIYYPDLKGSLLWRRLLRLFRKQLKATGSIDFTKISAFEIHAAHPLNSFIAAQYQISLDTTARELLVNLMCKEPSFRGKGYIDGYRLGAIAIFPNMEKKNAESSAAFTPIFPLDTIAPQHTFRLPVPEGSTHYLMCLKIEGCKSGKVNDNAPTQGMAVIGNGIWVSDKNETKRVDNDSREGTTHEDAEGCNTR